ncbi:hypothetical protein [Solimonas soli]|uniref:hypothetical protein n=1 Tax=Solimonas soli TaxID=413479 RepID=UPI000482AD7E|nr:hypothetical protein [Solimonas soli]
MKKSLLIGAALLAFAAAPQFALAAEAAPQHKTVTHKTVHKKTHKASAKKTAHKKHHAKKAAPAAQ